MRCINYLSEYLVPVVLFYIVGFAVLQKRPVFDDFIEGALAGLKTVAGILPTLVGLMAAVGVLRTSGFLDFLSGVLAGPAAFLHIPAQVVPLLLVRLVSSSAATGLLLDIFKTYGPDSRLGMMVSVLESCTETVFYTMSVYYLTVRISKTRWTLAGALIATFAGLVASILCSAGNGNVPESEMYLWRCEQSDRTEWSAGGKPSDRFPEKAGNRDVPFQDGHTGACR